MRALRTPDDRFRDLPGYDFLPNYVHVAAGDGSADTLRVHYLDEGSAAAAETVVTLHGEPTWSYIYRNLIPVLTGAGHRCIAPDLVGFGRSDKPAKSSDYTYQRHVDWVREVLFGRLGLDRITLLVQDWGGLIGLRLVAENPERFSRVIAANTGLPTGDRAPSVEFLKWLEFSQRDLRFGIGNIVKGGCSAEISADVMAAYDAPFPDELYKQGARKFPTLVPISESDPSAVSNRQAWRSLASFDKPFLCAFSDLDPITSGADRAFKQIIPGCTGRDHVVIKGGGHFLQEDRGGELAQIVNKFISDTA
ncbi:haloalkane dehalogenase [Streptomyces sp. NPDC005500]|uniref:haloalkane dehalogenase n=1 Tax=Streptomyces sp. NPDC005500 TaxID=3155007 RepID=UPI0033B8895E